MAVSKPHQLIVVGSDSGWLRLIDVVDTIVEVAEANNCQRSAILPLSAATQHSGIIIACDVKQPPWPQPQCGYGCLAASTTSVWLPRPDTGLGKTVRPILDIQSVEIKFCVVDMELKTIEDLAVKKCSGITFSLGTGKNEAAKKLSETRLATKVIKPPIEELDQFFEFQLPRQPPAYGDLLHAPRPKKNTSLSLQFTFLGPWLYVNTVKSHPAQPFGFERFWSDYMKKNQSGNEAKLKSLAEWNHWRHCSKGGEECLTGSLSTQDTVPLDFFQGSVLLATEGKVSQIYMISKLIYDWKWLLEMKLAWYWFCSLLQNLRGCLDMGGNFGLYVRVKNKSSFQRYLLEKILGWAIRGNKENAYPVHKVGFTMDRFCCSGRMLPEEVANVRHNALFRIYMWRTQWNAVAIQIHAHDPLRFVVDMLAASDIVADPKD
ncbi:hypothetical protein Tco_0038146 [Tanacetum coccineum]